MTEQSSRRRWLGLVFISIAVALIIVDSTIVNVAIPSIVDDLEISSTRVQWVQETYTLVFAALLLVFGTLADRFGRRRLLLIGVVIFSLASVLAALSTSGELLIGSRLLQGLGGAMILPSSLSIINATFRDRERAIAFAIWGSTIGGMAAVGPLLGGWLTTYYSWHWAFGINVPLGVIIVIGVFAFVQESREEGAPRRIDVVGALLSVVLFGSLVFGLIEGRTYGWWFSDSPPSFWTLDVSPIPFAFTLAIAAGVAFVLWGLHRERAGRSTMLAFGLFSIPSFRNGNIAALVVSLGEFGIILSLPLWLQNVLGYDALQTGFVILALAIGSFVASGFAGAFGNRISPVTIVRVGILAEIVGLLAVGLSLSTGASWLQVVPGLFVYGFGVGLATAQLTSVILKDVPISESGQGSGTQSTSRQVGPALGIAILGTILFTSLGTGLQARLEDQASIPADVRTQIVDAVVDSAGSAIPGLEAKSPDAATDAREAFTDATRYATFSAAGFLALGFLATLRLHGERPRREDPSPGAASPTPGAATPV
ncbi:EmrB/QacA subfamily drug resistance transporter [Leifsonia sp. AK011]|uniref:DHA2 family efflux MFS transporter permease subunit n=1 Tax=Leifsonia sp. AK011 TaxID=2723075 RepID=UPI0015CEA69B|nr:DHA2 family efflux MFS transporter permease subunit [Leifsonia sp. AK011]NYF09500.1 EmrB/QacA subfamily drug resistance transporter [Leifsonia sp. AK011]